VRLLIVFASRTGRTARLAEAAAEGARAAGAQVTLVGAGEARDDDLLAADAILLGSGVHMGGVESSMSAFFERSAPLWLQGRLIGRLGAAFVSAGDGGRGGGELALLRLLSFLAQNGCLLVPFHRRLDAFADAGCHWGVLSETNPRGGPPGPGEPDAAAARAQGRFLAECALRWGSAGAGVSSHR
jgi:NAD(P)H dehydrogenase (quinone)